MGFFDFLHAHMVFAFVAFVGTMVTIITAAGAVVAWVAIWIVIGIRSAMR